MSWSDDWRERRRHRRERIRKVILGDTPRPSRLERVSLVFAIVVGAYVCYRFRLVHAREFGMIGFAFVATYFAARRVWWSRKLARNAGGPS
jgi:hypothetical protein